MMKFYSLAFLEFLNPGLLFLLPLGLVPIIVHILNKPKPQRIMFPSLLFLTRILRRQNKFSRIKNFLLMFIRILLITLVVMAAARPQLSRTGPSEESVVVIIDNSFKMGVLENGISRFERARQISRRILEGVNFGQGQKAALLFTDRTYSELEANIDYLRMILEKQTLSWYFQDFSGPIKSAVAFTKGTRPTIYVVSDMSVSSWQNVEIPENVRIIAVDVTAGSQENIYFKDILVESENIIAVLNRHVNDATCTLILDGIPFATGRVQNGSVSFSGIDPNSSWGSIQLNYRDSLTVDNVIYFSMSEKARPKVQIDDISSPLRHALSETAKIVVIEKPQAKIFAVTAPTEIDSRITQVVPSLSFVGPRIVGVEKTIKWFDKSHPALKPFEGGKNGDIQSIKFLSEERGLDARNGRVIAGFHDGTPAVIEYKNDEKTHLVSSFSAYHPGTIKKEFFPVFVQAVLEYMVPASMLRNSFIIGHEHITVGDEVAGELKVKNLRDHSVTSVKIEKGGANLKIAEPCNYGASFGDKKMIFAVNLDPAASNLDKIQQLIKRVEIFNNQSAGTFRTQEDLPLLKIFICLAACFILLELLLAR